MKSILRSSLVQTALAAIICFWMALVHRTVRWTSEGVAEAKTTWSDPNGVIVACWHSRILLMPSGWTRHMRKWPGRRGPSAMLISASRDGEFVARAIGWLGLTPVRGSRVNKRKRDKEKGGLAAVHAASEILGAGGAICVTPDGPRGPRQRAGAGPILLAKKTGAPILLYALATRPAKRLNSWDRFILPFPFTRGRIVFAGEMRVSRDADVETARQSLEARLNAASRRAEVELGLTPVEPAALDAPHSADPAIQA